jgi:hypothetical protein
MKTLLAIVVLALSVNAFAQKHMVEFNNDSLALGSLSFNSTKFRGEDSSEEKSFRLSGNYAYSLTDHIQVGTQLGYEKNKFDGGSSEFYKMLLGATYNLSNDFRNSYYASVYAGWEWDQNHNSGETNTHNEDFITRVSVGKRFPLSMLNLENVTYSPEVSFTSTNPTKKTNTEWNQDLSFKFLQFSVFF